MAFKIITLSKHEAESRRVDPDWCYIPPEERGKMFAAFKKAIKGKRIKIQAKTIHDSSGSNFKSLWGK